MKEIETTVTEATMKNELNSLNKELESLKKEYQIVALSLEKVLQELGMKYANDLYQTVRAQVIQEMNQNIKK